MTHSCCGRFYVERCWRLRVAHGSPEGTFDIRPARISTRTSCQDRRVLQERGDDGKIPGAIVLISSTASRSIMSSSACRTSSPRRR